MMKLSQNAAAGLPACAPRRVLLCLAVGLVLAACDADWQRLTVCFSWCFGMFSGQCTSIGL